MGGVIVGVRLVQLPLSRPTSPTLRRPLKDPIYIAGTGYYFPEGRITNADLIAMVDTSEEWIDSRVGIRERRRAPDDMDTSDLGVRATTSALEDAGWKGEELDLLICATSTPDTLIPSTACYIGNKLGIDPVSFDVGAACSGFVYGLTVAHAMMVAQGYERVALCTAEKYTKVTDYTDRSSAIFFGDSAATVLLQREKPKVGFEVVDFLQKNLNEGADLVRTPVGGTFRQIGSKVRPYAFSGFRDRSLEMLARHDLGPGDLKAFAGHQANRRLLEAVAEAIELPPEKHWINVDRIGNQGGAGVISTFCEGVDVHRAELAAGDLFLLTVYGSGFTSGSTLLRRVDA